MSMINENIEEMQTECILVNFIEPILFVKKSNNGDRHIKLKCKELEIEIIAIECDKDHTHMFLNCLPTQSPSDIMRNIKGYTNKILREEFSELNKMPSLWTRSYFVSTAGNVCSETIKKYVENQKKRY